jgi:hypothetical protein
MTFVFMRDARRPQAKPIGFQRSQLATHNNQSEIRGNQTGDVILANRRRKTFPDQVNEVEHGFEGKSGIYDGFEHSIIIYELRLFSLANTLLATIQRLVSTMASKRRI